MPNKIYHVKDRYYKIVDTGRPYKPGYPEINEGATHLTMNTGFGILSFLTKSWGYICTSETYEDAAATILLFGRKQVPLGHATKSLEEFVVKEIPDYITNCE